MSPNTAMNIQMYITQKKKMNMPQMKSPNDMRVSSRGALLDGAPPGMAARVYTGQGPERNLQGIGASIPGFPPEE
jgi:hypothetical protein